MSNNYGPNIAKSRNSDLMLCIDPVELNSSGNLSQTDIVTNVHTTVTTSNNEERVEIGRDPWGRIALLDRSEGNDVGSNYDGGYTTSTYSGVDVSCAYRFTYFFRVDKKGSNGTLYFGLYGYNSSGSNIAVRNNGGSSGTTNPYFSYPGHAHSNFELGRWYMFVGYVHPSGSSGVTNDEAGFWDMATKTKIGSPSNGNVSHNAVWDSTHTKTRARFYLYYSTDPTVGMSWLMPRIEKIDGDQPTVAEMLNSPQDRLSNLANPSSGGVVSTFYPRGGGTSIEHTYKSTSLDGSSYLDLGTDKDFKTTAGWTISTWIKYDTVPAGYTDNQNSPGNFIGADSINYSSWYWSVFNNKLALWDKGNGGWYYGNTTLSADTWYHATLVSDSGNYYCYLNGEDDMSSTWSSHNGSWSSHNGLRIRYIGQGNASNPRRVDGNIASTQAWSRALTAAEIKQNFNQQRGRFGV